MPDPATAPTMRVTKRNGSTEPVDVNKIVRAVARCAAGVPDVDPLRVAINTISGLYDGATTQELDRLSIRTAAALVAEEPAYASLAARLLATFIAKEVQNQEIHSFSQSVARGVEVGLIAPRLAEFVGAFARKLNDQIDPTRDHLFEYFGLQTVYDRYLLRHPTTRRVIETPQHFFMRIACAVAESAADAVDFYRLFSSLEYLPSSPTLFNAGTRHEQLASCFLLDSPADDLAAIYRKYADVAQLSKFSGGIGLAYHRVRSRGSLIASTNGASNGVVPWLKTLDSSVASVNQCFAPETRVYTDRGLRPVADVAVGDLVLGISGAYRAVREAVAYGGDHAMVEVATAHGSGRVRVTAGHPFYAVTRLPAGVDPRGALADGVVRPEWREAGGLRPGDYVAQVVPDEVVPVAGFTEDDARLYGILLACGGAWNDEWSVTSGTPRRRRAVAFVEAYLAARDVPCVATRATGLNRRHGVAWALSAKLAFGLVDLAGDDGWDLGPRFAHLPRAQTIALVRGLLEGLCHDDAAACEVASTRPRLLEALGYQLLRLGVPTTLTRPSLAFERLWLLQASLPAPLAAAMERAATAPDGWFAWQNHVFSPVLDGPSAADSAAIVHDLVVDGDESYMTTIGLAHNGGRRKGACAVYLETWHADVEEFLELRDNTGDEARRTHNLNLANWIPDLFMRRVEAEGDWSFFDPKAVPHLTDLYGEAFDEAYAAAEAAGLATKTVKARDLYATMLRTLAQTGNGWMTFKDACNRTCNQTGQDGAAVHSSNLCVAPETLVLTDAGEFPIVDIVDQTVKVWNGEAWSEVTVHRTGVQVPLVRVTLANGTTLDCTPEHLFLVGAAGERKAAKDLVPNEPLALYALPPAGDACEMTWHQAWVRGVEDLGRVDDTYCFTEPLRHAGTFSGVVTGQCVAAETVILTSEGQIPIGTLDNHQVRVWNGVEWSEVTVRRTSDEAELLRVDFSDGASIECTPYHRFILSDETIVTADQLVAGNAMTRFALPVVEHGSPMPHAYMHGFFCGDGFVVEGQARAWLYGVKRNLLPHLDYVGTPSHYEPADRTHVTLPSMPPKDFVPMNADIQSRLQWLAGLCDADGTVVTQQASRSIQIGSVDPVFLGRVRLMLQTLGVSSKVTRMREAADRLLPDGRGGEAEYPCRDMYRLLVPAAGVVQLIHLGLPVHRLELGKTHVATAPSRFVRVTAVTRTGRRDATFCFAERRRNRGVFNGLLTMNCTEIIEVTSEKETAVCNIGSINLAKHLRDTDPGLAFDFDKLATSVGLAIQQLDRVIDITRYQLDSARGSNHRWRPVGLGLMGLQDVFFRLGLPFDGVPARELSRQISEAIYFHALTASCRLAETRGTHAAYPETRTARGELQFDAWGVQPSDRHDWAGLRDRIRRCGLRNSLLVAIAPTATIASIAGCYECIEPQVSNLFKRETMSGDFLQTNKHLVAALKVRGLWTQETRDAIKLADGSVQEVASIPAEIREVFRTVWEIPQRALIDMAADRGPFVDQSQSLNLFVANPEIGRLSAMYFYAWKKGLKTTYYLRSRPATRIAKTTVGATATASEAPACSIENGAACEACQ